MQEELLNPYPVLPTSPEIDGINDTLDEKLNVNFMRSLVAAELTDVQLEFYKLQEIANPGEGWLDFLRVNKGGEEEEEEEEDEEEVSILRGR